MKKGFKALNSDMTCRDFKFKIGKVYTHKGKISLCGAGFHYCENFFDVYQYYPKSVNTIIAEVEDTGDKSITEGDKTVTNKIKLVRVLSEREILEKVLNNSNSGDWNSGDGNSGDGNSGNRNSGNRNSGDGNSGYGNSGNRNSGNRNSGDWNSGDGNSGNRNSGYGNSGNRNSGDWNSGDGNSGYFNTKVPVYFFNKPSTTEYTKELENKLRSLNVKPILSYIYSDQMTEEEKKNNPSHKVTGGFLRSTGRHDWRYLTEEDKTFIKSLPNFDNEIFKVISNGVSLLDETIEVVVNGVTKTILKEKAKELGLI